MRWRIGGDMLQPPFGPILTRVGFHRGVADGVDALGGRLAVLGRVEVEPAVCGWLLLLVYQLLEPLEASATLLVLSRTTS
jgi:hypothetical protein